MGAVANCCTQWFGTALVAHCPAKTATRDFWHRFPPAICEREQAALTSALSIATRREPSATHDDASGGETTNPSQDAGHGLFDLSEQHNCRSPISPIRSIL